MCGSIASGDTFLVLNTGDSDAGSLREAINSANANPGLDSIAFDIPGPGPHTIQPLTRLPSITDTLTIDGYTQSGAGQNTKPPGIGSNAVLMVELDGTHAGSADGLVILASNCVAKGLVINRFRGAGIVIYLEPANKNVVQGNFIGTDVSGSIALGNGEDGVRIEDSEVNIIGGSQAGEGNVISGNDRAGILVLSTSRRPSGGHVISGNFIGTDVTGTGALGNTSGIVLAEDTQGNTIGGTTPQERNVISGNRESGINILGSHNTVSGNFIGTDVTGSADLGNAEDGVRIENAADNTIGGSQNGERNVISGNDKNGVLVSGAGANGNTVNGNFIGTDVTGNIDLGNSVNGVYIQDAPDNRIGVPHEEQGAFTIMTAGEASPGIDFSREFGEVYTTDFIRTRQLYYIRVYDLEFIHLRVISLGVPSGRPNRDEPSGIVRDPVSGDFFIVQAELVRRFDETG